MAIDTGWTNIFLSNFPSSNNLQIKRNKIQASNGSVGNDKFTGISGTISFNWIDKGVKKTTANRTLSKDTNVANTNRIITGINAK